MGVTIANLRTPSSAHPAHAYQSRRDRVESLYVVPFVLKMRNVFPIAEKNPFSAKVAVP